MRVAYSKSAAKQLAKMDGADAARVSKAVEKLAQWPSVSNVKALKGEWSGHYRLRVADWRVIFQVKDAILIVKIAHRREVYD